MNVFALRLKPDQDLKHSLKAFAIAHQLQAGCIVSAIGSLKTAAIRFADRPCSTILKRRFEILSLHGTLSINGLHLHMALADADGTVIGGHVDVGCIIYTTAEIVIGEIPDLLLDRAIDNQTGFLELSITER